MRKVLLADAIDMARVAGAARSAYRNRIAARMAIRARDGDWPIGAVPVPVRVPATLSSEPFRTALIAVLEALGGSCHAGTDLSPGGGVTRRSDAMATIATRPLRVDPVWDRIRDEAEDAIAGEPLIGGMVHASVLHHKALEDALAYRMAARLSSAEIGEQILREIAGAAYAEDESLGMAARADLVAVLDRDPVTHRLLQPLLYFKGFQAIQAQRVAHHLWNRGRRDLAYVIQMRTSEAFGVDIHPGARLGKGIMIDHPHSVVIGETAVVGDNVSMLHSVTLGGTGKEDEDRHPKIGDGVLIGAGAKVLGNIRIGHCSRIAAGSVVLEEVPPCKTVAGVPARIVGEAGCAQPSQSMNHLLTAAGSGAA
jgi:serine O-acetyltransferase